MGKWTARVAAALHSIEEAARRFGRRKIRSTPFGEKNGKEPFNASGVVQVGPRRFVFVDNHDPSALFELALTPDGGQAERIWRRPLLGLVEGQLLDPEGLTGVEHDGENFIIAASSLCVRNGNGPGRQRLSDGLVRVRYTSGGDLHTEVLDGFRAWLLTHEPSLVEAAGRVPDAGGLNVEGVAWDPRTRVLVFGLRGPADAGRIAVVRVPVDAGGAPWAISSLGAPSLLRITVPKSSARQGIRDISFDDETGIFLIVLGRSKSAGNEPFQLCTWDGSSDEVRLLDVTFHRSMKPEGVTTFSDGCHKSILIVDDGGGYAVLDWPNRPH